MIISVASIGGVVLAHNELQKIERQKINQTISKYDNEVVDGSEEVINGIEIKHYKYKYNFDTNGWKNDNGHSYYIINTIEEYNTFLEKYYNILLDNEFDRILDDWRRLTNTLGNIVEVKQLNETIIGKAYDINDDGSLIIKKENGEFRTILAGDCSIKKMK